MTIFKRGNKFWYEFTFMGARIRESTRCKSRGDAERYENERKRDLALGMSGLKRPQKAIKAKKAVDDYRDQRKPHWAERTRGIHEGSWKHLEPVFAKMLLSDISAQTISRYQSKRQEEEASGRSINIEIGLIRQVMIHHRIWQTIAPDVTMLSEREDIGRALSADEEASLLAAAHKSVSRSLYTAILVSIHTGVRNEELRLLRWSQVDFLKEQIQVGKSKTRGGEGRIIPLSGTALATLKDWHAQFPNAKPTHYVFPSERYGLHGKKDTFGGVVKVYECDPLVPIASWKSSWTTCRELAKVECRWHDLRHTFVSKMGENGVPEQTLLALTGHMSRKMLERYSHSRNEAKRAAVKMFDVPREEGYPQNPPQNAKQPKELAPEIGLQVV
ncbi:MAG: site-specific integrase [Acidobacteriaceae bacterium]